MHFLTRIRHFSSFWKAKSLEIPSIDGKGYVNFTNFTRSIPDPAGCFCCNKKLKNKMKPTNPNADTYVEEQKQYLFITFSSEPTCGTPWRDTLRWHSCRTPFLLDALTWHSCKTLLLDTLAWHSSGTLLLDILVRHSYLTLFWDTLTCHFCKTLLTWHSCKTLLTWHFLLDTLVRHSCLTLLLGHSYLTLL